MKKITAIALLSLFSLSFLFSEDNTVKGEFWTDPQTVFMTTTALSPFSEEEGTVTCDELEHYREESISLLLEEARWVFSGMIYGFRFVYVPSDTKREIEEIFLLEPLAMIPRGDPNLKVLSVTETDGRYYMTLAYTLEPYQELRVESWISSVFVSSGGSGEAPFHEESCSIRAAENAVKDGLRNYLRPLEYNKPRKVEGLVAFRAVPVKTYISGGCRMDVKIQIRIDKIRDFIP